MIALTDIITVTAALAAFGTVMAVWIIGMMIWMYRRSRHARKVEHRLGLPEEHPEGTRVLRLWHDGEEVTTTVSNTVQRLSFKDRLDKTFRNAGWRSPTRTVLMGLAGFMFLAATATLALTSNWVASIMISASVLLLFWIYTKQRISRRESLFERQFVEAIGLASRSLHAGHPLTGAFRLISEEVSAPVGNLFEDICQQQSLGVSLETALRNIAARSDSSDMKMFATSVMMQLRSGGNLADMMERLADVIRDRMRLNRRVKVLTAQTQFSKRVLLALPILVFAILNTMNPNYMEPLYTTAEGKLMLAIGGAALLLGAWIMNKMADVKY